MRTAKLAVLVSVLAAGVSYGQLRKVSVGDKMPEFSLTDAKAAQFAYKHGGKKVMAVVFLSQKQNNSLRGLEAVRNVVSELKAEGASFELVAVTNEEPDEAFVEACGDNGKWLVRLLVDRRYQLWGKVGVIAMPTAVVVGKDDTIEWIKVGYGHQFGPGLRAYMQEALGLIEKGHAQKSLEVRTADHNGPKARQERHLRMARMLEKKGRHEFAIRELRKAYELDPNSADVLGELGGLLCRTGRGDEAIELVAGIKPADKAQQARLLEISGWAKRQAGQSDNAEKDLLEAIKADPRAARAFFELGKLYQDKGKLEESNESYRKALNILFEEAPAADTKKR